MAHMFLVSNDKLVNALERYSRPEDMQELKKTVQMLVVGLEKYLEEPGEHEEIDPRELAEIVAGLLPSLSIALGFYELVVTALRMHYPDIAVSLENGVKDFAAQPQNQSDKPSSLPERPSKETAGLTETEE